MRKSPAILVSAIALGLAMFVPFKASAQGVSIYIGPGYPAYGGYPPYGGYPAAGYPAYPAPHAYSYPTYGYAYPSYGYGARNTAVIGDKAVAWHVEFIDDMSAGTKVLNAVPYPAWSSMPLLLRHGVEITPDGVRNVPKQPRRNNGPFTAQTRLASRTPNAQVWGDRGSFVSRYLSMISANRPLMEG
jgi:hypothetical protein